MCALFKEGSLTNDLPWDSLERWIVADKVVSAGTLVTEDQLAYFLADTAVVVVLFVVLEIK